MPLPAPLSTLSSYVTVGFSTARCLACQDTFGNPLKINKNGVRKHIDSAAHITNVTGLKRLRNSGIVQPPKSNLPRVKADTAVDTPTFGFSSSAPLVPESDVPSDSFEDLLTILKHLTPLYDAPNPGDTLRSTSDDLFEDCITHGPPVPKQHGMASDNDDEQQSEQSGSDSEEEGYESPKPHKHNIGPSPMPRQTSGSHTNPLRVDVPCRYIVQLAPIALLPRTNASYSRVCTRNRGSEYPLPFDSSEGSRETEGSNGQSNTSACCTGGSVFHLNKIAETLKLDMANPHLRPHMNFLPHMEGKHMSQAWHGFKMVHEVSDSVLTPFLRVGDRIYYVNELVRQKNDFFIPLRWITRGHLKELYAIGYHVIQSPSGLVVQSEKRRSVKVSTFLETFTEMQQQGAIPMFSDASAGFQAKMPHPLCAVAGSRPVYSIPLIIFMDDASGNTSKQWNKHWSCYLSNAALPREVLQAEYNVRFVSTSPHATPLELMHGIRSSIDDAFHNPTVAFDCLNHEEVLIRPFPLFWAGDNPMQAEHCSSSGLASNKFCRTCEVGGDTNFKQSIEGYRTLFKPGATQTVTKTRQLIDERLEMALKPRMIQKVKDHVSNSGIKDPVAQPLIDQILTLGKDLLKADKNGSCRPAQEVEDILKVEVATARKNGYINPLLDMEALGVDIHLDTPTEILHTVLLGVVKYFWAQSVFVLEKDKKLDLLASRLALYQGSLIGKHFKAIVQVMPFVTYNLFVGNTHLMTAWLLLGRLTSMLWYPVIDDIDVYLNKLRELIHDFLLLTAECSPSIMILKPKFHFLSFNGVFRAASTFSNRQAPSRDIARHLQTLNAQNIFVQVDIGRRGNSGCVQAQLHHTCARKNKPSPMARTCSSYWGLALRRSRNTQHTYIPAVSLVSQSGDVVKAGSDILLQDQSFGHVRAIFIHWLGSGNNVNYVLIQRYKLGNRSTGFLTCQYSLVHSIAYVPAAEVECLVNLQHIVQQPGSVDVQKSPTRSRNAKQLQGHYFVSITRTKFILLSTFTRYITAPAPASNPTELYSRKTQLLDEEAIFSTAVEKMRTNRAEKARITAAKRAAKAMVEEAIAGSTGDEANVPPGLVTATAAAAATSTSTSTTTTAQLRKRKNTTSSDANAHVTQRQSSSAGWPAHSRFAHACLFPGPPPRARPAPPTPRVNLFLTGYLALARDLTPCTFQTFNIQPGLNFNITIFPDEDRGDHQFDKESETLSNVDEGEVRSGPVGQAAPTTGSAFDHIDLSRITTPPALLAFAEGCCEEYRLSAIAKEDVMRTTALPGATFMAIRLYARMMAMGQNATKAQVEDFLRSSTFKENIKRRIQGGLLDPNIPYYVRGCTARFVRHMRENPASYEIPQVVQEGLMTTRKFSSAIAEILSGFRGELRRKIFGSIEDKTDIASTGEKLSIQGFQISEDHLKQFALLRQLSEDYIKAEVEAQAKKAVENANAQVGNRGRGKKRRVDGAPQKTLAFWTYIDTQMSRFRKYPIAKRTELLKHILRQDRKKYPDRTGQARWFPPSNQLIVSQWQADASYSIQVMAGYTLTAAQEGSDAPPTGSGDPDEAEGPANRDDLPEEEGQENQEDQEEDGTLGGDEGGRNAQGGIGTNGDFQEDAPSLFDDEVTHTSTQRRPEDRHTSDGPGTAQLALALRVTHYQTMAHQVIPPRSVQYSETPPSQWALFEEPPDHKAVALQPSRKHREVARSP
ncbi:hypothetical protein RHS01_06641 [Rhizoctonia solani]|uniref:Uncharacterized protein n=1 Tax=Rhizoctonia solani TaxID=456999 RepID=A0A8H7M0I7_9AGAM|nr:hypothetical protein RHS01_06641 [Rhizoctonia solani]